MQKFKSPDNPAAVLAQLITKNSKSDERLKRPSALIQQLISEISEVGRANEALNLLADLPRGKNVDPDKDPHFKKTIHYLSSLNIHLAKILVLSNALAIASNIDIYETAIEYLESQANKTSES